MLSDMEHQCRRKSSFPKRNTINAIEIEKIKGMPELLAVIKIDKLKCLNDVRGIPVSTTGCVGADNNSKPINVDSIEDDNRLKTIVKL